jgi:triosephosphate isomerase
MNFGPRQATAFVRQILPELEQLIISSRNAAACVLCPPAISLPAVAAELQQVAHQPVDLGAQNMYFEASGAYTGEISPEMVSELCRYVILGHSERRTLFGETDALVNKKLLAAFKAGLTPIVCIGENLEQYEAGATHEIIRAQVSASLASIPTEKTAQVVIAYEPIWAIGTGRAATAKIASTIIHLIRTLYAKMYGTEAAASLRILYGGSVTATNIAEYVADSDIDGALVGGASLKPDFVEILRATISAKQQH